MPKIYDILLLDVPQEDGDTGDEEHVTHKLFDIITRGGQEYHRTEEKIKLDGKQFRIYRAS